MKKFPDLLVSVIHLLARLEAWVLKKLVVTDDVTGSLVKERPEVFENCDYNSII